MVLASVVLALVLEGSRAEAAGARQEGEASVSLPETDVLPALEKPAPYSIPWHLRPVLVVTAVRSDTVVAFQDRAATIVSFLGAAFEVGKNVGIGVRSGWVHQLGEGEAAASAFTNTALSATHASRLSTPLRLALTAGVVLPSGQGGGTVANPRERAAIVAGSLARSGIDNTMFAANDVSLLAGVSLAWIAHGLTVQADLTGFEYLRVRAARVQEDAWKTAATAGVHVGYFVVPWLSAGAEVRYQILLYPGRALPGRDSLTASAGVRVHVPVGAHVLRPGVAYAHPIDDPMAALGYRIVQVDVPFVF